MEETVHIIGAPMDLGANRRGVDMGPSAIRYADLLKELQSLGKAMSDGGNVQVPQHAERHASPHSSGEATASFLPEVETVCRRLSTAVSETVSAGKLPLVLGGDHSIAIGTVGGLSQSGSLGTIWFDAHADFNTPSTSPSGNVHGMPLAAILGNDEFEDSDWARASAVDEENVVLVGLRSVDDAERESIRSSDVTAYTMADIDARGITEIVTEAIDIATDGTDGVHVSLDLDWPDPTQASGVGTPERGGVSYREAHAAMELLDRHVTQADLLAGMELVEVNPILDERNETAELAVELAASALGKQIL